MIDVGSTHMMSIWCCFNSEIYNVKHLNIEYKVKKYLTLSINFFQPRSVVMLIQKHLLLSSFWDSSLSHLVRTTERRSNGSWKTMSVGLSISVMSMLRRKPVKARKRRTTTGIRTCWWSTPTYFQRSQVCCTKIGRTISIQYHHLKVTASVKCLSCTSSTYILQYI